MKKRKKNMWDEYHPAVCAGLHILLEEDSANLSFIEEYKLGTGSKAIDCLIIKKDKKISLKKDIGRIFRGHNLLEIKGYRDYLSLDKFYRAFGYALFYKADTEKENTIDIEDVTLTFINVGFPKKLINHLENVWGIRLIKNTEGLYYLEGFAIPMQIVVASELDEKTSELAKRLLQKGIPCQDVAECMEFSVERVKKLQQELVQTV